MESFSNNAKMQTGFFITLLVGALVLFYLVIEPFVSAIFLAIITTVLFRPLNLDLIKITGRKNLSALLTTVFVLIVLLVPFAIVGNLLVLESADLYSSAVEQDLSNYSLNNSLDRLEGFVGSIIPNFNVDFDRFLNINQYIGSIFAWFSGNLTAFFSGLLRLTLSAFVYVLCVFFLFRDGDRLAKNVLNWSPLFDKHDNLILSKISTAINSVIKGQILIGLIQGLMTGVGLWIFGVPNPVIWGTVAAVASLLPMVGAGLVNIPAVIYLLLNGQVGFAIGLAVWAAVAVGLIDNILAPYLINRGVKIHSFAILISVLGGISFFGPIGFIAGPVLLSLLFALLELYPVIVGQNRSSQINNNV